MVCCKMCEFCFPQENENFSICAGGSLEDGYFKNYGDSIKSFELEILHNCRGYGISFEAFLARYSRNK